MSPSTAPALRAYQDRSVQTATPEQLVVLLYDGAARFLIQAAAAMRAGDLERSNGRMQRAEAILDELLTSLHMEAGGEMAENLRDLYLYCRRRLVDARLARSPEMIDEVRELLSNLGEAWKQIAGR